LDWALHVPELDLAIKCRFAEGQSIQPDVGHGRLKRSDVEHPADEEPVHVPLNDAAVAALRVVQARGDGKGRVF